MTQELVVLSGKGGTGKTSLTASLAILADQLVLADCDTDAPDMHIVLSPHMEEQGEFSAGHLAVIDQKMCDRCGLCRDLCRFDAVRCDPGSNGKPAFSVGEADCEGCGVCVRFCPSGAISFPMRRCGEWRISRTRAGMMAHASLDVPGESSGRLVSLLRAKARDLAEATDIPLIIIDGPPGIGCPAIASVTGASHVLLVTEPSLSGEHDLCRAIELAAHFRIPTSVCVNRWDINPDLTEGIESLAWDLGAHPVGRIRLDPGVTAAQMRGCTVVETDTPAAADIRSVWNILMRRMQTSQHH